MEKFWSKVEKTDTCWLWTAGLNGSEEVGGGYGYYHHGSVMQVAHRVAYEEVVGPIPEGMVLDHLCRVRKCVRPDHLEIVTIQENVLRGVGMGARNAKKTHCPQGHEYTEENLVKLASGFRRCKQCKRDDYSRKKTS